MQSFDVALAFSRGGHNDCLGNRSGRPLNRHKRKQIHRHRCTLIKIRRARHLRSPDCVNLWLVGQTSRQARKRGAVLFEQDDPDDAPFFAVVLPKSRNGRLYDRTGTQPLVVDRNGGERPTVGLAVR